MPGKAGTRDHGRVLRCLLGLPVLVAFVVMHLMLCSFAVGEAQPHEHQSVAQVSDGHSPVSDAADEDCGHHQSHDFAGTVCWVAARPLSLLIADLAALPAVLAVQPVGAIQTWVGPPGPHNGTAGDQLRAGRNLLISVGIART